MHAHLNFGYKQALYFSTLAMYHLNFRKTYFGITTVLPCLEIVEARRLVIAIEDKSLVLATPKQRKRLKHLNRTVNPQAFVKTLINRDILVSLYTIYQALKFHNCPALMST